MTLGTTTFWSLNLFQRVAGYNLWHSETRTLNIKIHYYAFSHRPTICDLNSIIRRIHGFLESLYDIKFLVYSSKVCSLG